MAKKKKNMTIKSRILLVGMILTAVAALPTTVLFFIGMMPTVVARIADRTAQRTRVLTIGFMNFAACFPFWYQLMKGGHSFDLSVRLVTDPLNISIMYGGALVGYLIEWGLAGIVAGVMVQKGKRRLEDIKKYQQDLVDRWGPEVMGDMPLDPNGFPLEENKKE